LRDKAGDDLSNHKATEDEDKYFAGRDGIVEDVIDHREQAGVAGTTQGGSNGSDHHHAAAFLENKFKQLH
jgi:hypothetical protein